MTHTHSVFLPELVLLLPTFSLTTCTQNTHRLAAVETGLEVEVRGRSEWAPIRTQRCKQQTGQMNGESVPRLVEGFFQPLRTALDCIFVAGVSCGVGRLAAFSWRCWRGFRIFCLPFGRCTRGSLKDRFGEWAGTLKKALLHFLSKKYFHSYCRSYFRHWTSIR